MTVSSGEVGAQFITRLKIPDRRPASTDGRKFALIKKHLGVPAPNAATVRHD